jgi:hypothetical protein
MYQCVGAFMPGKLLYIVGNSRRKKIEECHQPSRPVKLSRHSSKDKRKVRAQLARLADRAWTDSSDLHRLSLRTEALIFGAWRTGEV